MLYNDEDSPLNGVLLGTAGVLRLRLFCSGAHHAQDGILVLPSQKPGSLDKLLKEASSIFSMDVDSLVTASGDRVGEGLLYEGRACIQDSTPRCLFDGTELYAVPRGQEFVRPS